VEHKRSEAEERRLDLAARAAWLYYIGGNTQDEIAAKLSLSRQAAQRLVSLAVSEKLIKFRLDHRLAQGLVLAQALRERFELSYCDVVPIDPATASPLPGIATAAADYIETWLGQKTPQILAFSTGITLRAVISEISGPPSPQHSIVSLVGSMSRDGRAGWFEVAMRLAERIGAQCFLMSAPVVASSIEERNLLQTQRSYLAVRELAEHADVAFVGIGQIAHEGALQRDGFVNDTEMTELIDKGGLGEIAGWAFDRNGALVEGGVNDRVAAVPLARPAVRPTIGVAGGQSKVAAIRGALRGRLVTGLITDEATADALLRSSARLDGHEVM
jgi:DNA-binding transcriptional regulator LsrR (DeoR family)